MSNLEDASMFFSTRSIALTEFCTFADFIYTHHILATAVTQRCRHRDPETNLADGQNRRITACDEIIRRADNVLSNWKPTTKRFSSCIEFFCFYFYLTAPLAAATPDTGWLPAASPGTPMYLCL